MILNMPQRRGWTEEGGTSLKPGNEVTVKTSTGQKHKFSLSSHANTTISPDVTTGSTVIVTECTSVRHRLLAETVHVAAGFGAPAGAPSRAGDLLLPARLAGNVRVLLAHRAGLALTGRVRILLAGLIKKARGKRNPRAWEEGAGSARPRIDSCRRQ
jgi:hypothetical protein